MNLVQTNIPDHANILQMLWNPWKTLKIPWNFLLLNGRGWTYMILTYVTLLQTHSDSRQTPPGNPTCCNLHFRTYPTGPAWYILIACYAWNIRNSNPIQPTYQTLSNTTLSQEQALSSQAQCSKPNAICCYTTHRFSHLRVPRTTCKKGSYQFNPAMVILAHRVTLLCAFAWAMPDVGRLLG